MTKRKLALFALLLGTVVQCISQATQDFISLKNFVPPSPEAAALARYGQVPVNYSSGIPSISVPFYEVKSRTLSLPLSLSYHASGIKVEDIATTAGLGWALNAGGVISRNVVGKADEGGMRGTSVYYKDRSQLNVQYNGSGNDTNFTYLQNIVNGTIDLQSDVYDINTPSFTGRFVYDIVTKQPRYTPLDRQINIIWNSTDQTYTVIDDSGIKYVFGEKEMTATQYTNNITAWYMTLIISPDLTDTIYLKYANAANFYDAFASQNYSVTVAPDFPGSPYCPPTVTITDNYNVQLSNYTYQRKLIDSIKFSAGYVKFNYENDRQDPGTERLSSILVGSGTMLNKKIELQHSYFLSDTTTSNIPLKARKRLKLDEVNFKDSSSGLAEKYSFEYNTQTKLPCYFLAYNGSFPIGKTAGYDYWGYANGGNSYLIPTGFRTYLATFMSPYGAVSNSILSSYDSKSSDRYPNPTMTQAFMLTKINYPTGGFTQFEYENNKVFNNGDNHDYTGGLRIKRMLSCDNRKKIIVNNYAYGDSTGTGISISRIVPEDFYYSLQTRTKHPTQQGMVLCDGSNFYVNTNPTTAINYYGGSPVFYTKVTEYNGYPGDNQGKTEYFFDYNSDSVYNSPDTEKYWNFSTDRGWARGSLLSTKTYKYANGNYTLLKKVVNTYSSLGISTVKVGYVCEQKILYSGVSLEGYLIYWKSVSGDVNLLNYFDYIDVVLPYGIKKLIKTEETTYVNSDSLIAKRENFYESSYHLYPTKVKTYSSDGSVYSQVTKYSQDKASIQNLTSPASAALDSMISKKILSVPVETESYVATTLLTRNRIDFVNWNSSNRYYEQYRSTQLRQNPMEQRIQYKSYDERGNVTSVGKINDVDIVYIWDYKKNYPVAQVTNAAVNEAAYESFEAEGSGTWTVGSSSRVTSSFFTGKKAYELSNGNITKSGLTSGKTYVISYWSLTGSSKVVNGNSGTSKMTRLGWTLFEHKVASTSITVSGSGVIDELRLYPENAMMTSYTYTPLVGINTANAPNDIVNFYEYDGFGRLLRIRDIDNNILKQVAYKYQHTDIGTANWQPTGNYQSSNGGISEREEKDMNSSSPTYNQTQWVLHSISPVAPNWLIVSGQTRCKPNVTTGEQEQMYKDQNLYSSSYGQVKWVTTGVVCTCISPPNCTGPDKKMISGCCETGLKVYTSFYYDSYTNLCNATYHYEWSDASWSQDYYEAFSGECPEGN